MFDVLRGSYAPQRNRSVAATAVALVLTLLSACGPSAKELADREAERQRIALQEAQRRSERLSVLQANADARIRGGETPPASGADPGHEFMLCRGVVPVPFTMNTPMRLLNPVICGNSAEGQKLLAYRRWYCGPSDNDCALSEWANGRPTLRSRVGASMVINFRVETSRGVLPIQIAPFNP